MNALPAHILTAATRIMKHASVQAVIVFGSRTSPNAPKSDDWDIAVVMRSKEEASWPSLTMIHLGIVDVLKNAHIRRISQEDLYAGANDGDDIASAIARGHVVQGRVSLPIEAMDPTIFAKLLREPE